MVDFREGERLICAVGVLAEEEIEVVFTSAGKREDGQIWAYVIEFDDAGADSHCVLASVLRRAYVTQ
jgi:hypothetical protein